MMDVSEDKQVEQRRDAIRRMQVGVTGLILVALLVGLSTLLTGQAREDAEIAKAQAEAAGVVNPGGDNADGADPLIDLGAEPAVVLPSSRPPTRPAAPTPGTAAPTAPLVPDLEPDPQLKGSERR